MVRKQDIYTAKNYLQQGEIDTLNRLTTLFLDTAELRVRERKDLTLRYWRETVDGLLNFKGKVVLQGTGSVSNRQMEEHVNAIYEQFNARQIDRDALNHYDLIICADRSNLRAIERLFGPSDKLSLMMHWASEERDVSDPWYTRDFESAYRDILASCQGLLNSATK